MATKKLRVRHKKRTYRQRRSQRRVVGGWGGLPSLPSFNMPNNLNEIKARAAAAAAAAQQKAAEAGTSLKNTATEFANKAKNEAILRLKPKFNEYRERIIEVLQGKINSLNEKEQQQQLSDIEKKLKDKLPELINMLNINNPSQQNGGRSKRTTRRKIQKGGFIGSIVVMLSTEEGRKKLINEVNSDPEMFNMILGVIVGIFGENSPVSRFIRENLIRQVPQPQQ